MTVKLGSILLSTLAVFLAVLAMLSVNEPFDPSGEKIIAVEKSSRVRVTATTAADSSEAPRSGAGPVPQRHARQGVVPPQIQPPSEIVVLEKGGELSPDLEEGERVEFFEEENGKALGIRSRLLITAAHKALKGDEPWLDLAKVARSFQKLGHHERSQYWFERASRLAFDPDDQNTSSRRLRQVLKELLRAKFYDLGEDLITRIPNESEQAWARRDLVESLARAKRFHQAEQLALSIPSFKIRLYALGRLATYRARYQGLDEAWETLQIIPDSAERDQALASVATARAALGDAGGAVDLLPFIKDPSTRDSAQAKIEEPGKKLAFEALVPLLHDRFFHDSESRALIYSEALRRGVDLKSRYFKAPSSELIKAKAYESLVDLHLRHGNFQPALKVAQKISRSETRSKALQSVALGQFRHNKSHAARQTADLILSLGERESAYAAMAKEAVKLGRTNEARKAIQVIQSPLTRSATYAECALIQARNGQARFAWSMLQDARRGLAGLENEYEKDRVRRVIVEAMSRTGDSASALGVASVIQDEGLRDRSYQEVAVIHAEKRELSLASNSARLIQSDPSREKAFSKIATTFAKRVSLTDALSYLSHFDSYSNQVSFLLGVVERRS